MEKVKKALEDALDIFLYLHEGVDYYGNRQNYSDEIVTTRLALAELEQIQQEPAQEEDQSHSSIQLAKMIMSDCGVSDNCESLVNRIAGRIDAALKQEPAQAVPVAKVVTVGGYPDDSQHTVEWLVKHKDLRDGQLLYTAPPALDDETRKMVLELCDWVNLLGGFCTPTMRELARKIPERLEAGNEH